MSQPPAPAAVPLAGPARELPGELLQRSRQAVQEAYASQALAEQSLEAPLAQLLQGPPVSCSPETPLRDALAEMQRRRGRLARGDLRRGGMCVR